MKHLSILSFVILLASCATKPSPVITQMPPPVPATMLPTEGIESVRYSENLKAYNLGRYIDPNNPLIIHERHPVYRVETTAKWNLHPNAPATVPLGPALGIVDAAHKDAPATADVVAELNKQKAATQAVIEQGNRLNEMLGQLATTLNASRQLTDQNQQLRKELNLTKQRLDLLEAELRHQPKANPAAREIPNKEK